MASATRAGKGKTGRQKGGEAAPPDGIIVMRGNAPVGASELEGMTLGDLLRFDISVAGHRVRFKEERHSGNVGCVLGDQGADVMMYPFPIGQQATDFLAKLHRAATEIRT